MSKEIPIVQKYMTYNPISINKNELISKAQELMKTNTIRHLPVTDGDTVIGVLSDRDIKTAVSFLKADSQTTIEGICNTHIYTTEPETHIDIVAETMAENHYGCVIVLQNNKLVGIFTTNDACRALAEITRQRFHG